MNEVAFFEIQADDPERAMGFYGDLFGWKFAKQTGPPNGYWQIEGAGIRGGLLPRPASAPAPHSGTNAFTCSVMVADFDATAARITELGGEVALPKFAVPGKCWQGYFVDTELNTFGIFEVDEAAK